MTFNAMNSEITLYLIARMHSARLALPTMNATLYAHQWVTLPTPATNVGCQDKYCMASVAAHIIGTTISLPSSKKWVYRLLSMTRVSLQFHHLSQCSLFPHQPVQIGLYVDDFIFYFESDKEEELFRQELKRHCMVNFMGDIDYFLGMAFT